MPTLVDDQECPECSVSLTIELPESFSHIAHLRRKVRFVLERFGISIHDADDIEVIIGELATNVVRHAKGGNYKVSIELVNVQAVVLVIDKGVGFVPDAVANPGTERTDGFCEGFDMRIGGFGLPLVRSLSQDVQIIPNETVGMTVRAVKNLQPKL